MLTIQNNEGICNALKFLAGRCDYARTQDGIGFNGVDTGFGHDLADKCDKWNLTSKQHFAALKMMTKYRDQLARAGIILPTYEELDEFIKQRDFRIALEKASRPAGIVDLKDSNIRIKFDYDPRLITIVKSIGIRPGEYAKARWNQEEKLWELPAEYLIDVRDSLPEDFEFTPDAISLLFAMEEERLERAEAEDEARRLRDWEFAQLMGLVDLDAPLANGRTLYKHQKQAVETIFRLKNLIIADDMGLGKSLESLVAAKAYKQLYQCPIFVVAPASLQENWRREAAMADVEIELFSFHHASIPTPLDYEDYILIVDEAHGCQNLASLRTKAAIALATDKKCRACLLLTGTPLKNGNPMNLFPLLVMMQHDLGQDKAFFKKTYCRGKASHLDQLHRVITKEKPCLLRRTKKQCLDLPLKTQIMREAEVSTLAKAAYDYRFQELRDIYEERIRTGVISSEGEFLVLLTHLRHAASWAKVETTIDLAEEILENGEQVVVFAAFHDTAEKIAEALNAEIIDGEANAKKMTQGICDRFQEGRSQALVCLFGAGGIGLNLTAASTVILTDRPWTPGDTAQAGERILRIGQTKPTLEIWIQAFLVDYKIDQILQKKATRIDLVLKGQRSTFRGTDNIGDIAEELLEEIF